MLWFLCRQPRPLHFLKHDLYFSSDSDNFDHCEYIQLCFDLFMRVERMILANLHRTYTPTYSADNICLQPVRAQWGGPAEGSTIVIDV